MSSAGLVYVCARCRAFGKPQYGDQREPGPFLTKGWKYIGAAQGNVPICVDCAIDLNTWIEEGKRDETGYR